MDIVKVKITRISVKDKDKEGKILTGKFGPYYRVGILTDRFGETWLSGFSSKPNPFFEGEEVDLLVEDNVKDGKTYKNFKIPRKEDLMEIRIKKLEDAVFGDKTSNGSAPQTNPNDDDLPF